MPTLLDNLTLEFGGWFDVWCYDHREPVTVTGVPVLSAPAGQQQFIIAVVPPTAVTIEGRAIVKNPDDMAWVCSHASLIAHAPSLAMILCQIIDTVKSRGPDLGREFELLDRHCELARICIANVIRGLTPDGDIESDEPEEPTSLERGKPSGQADTTGQGNGGVGGSEAAPEGRSPDERAG